jgi:hypothetical protein
MFGNFLNGDINKIRTIVQTKLGVLNVKKQDMIVNRVVKLIEQLGGQQQINQIFAVISGEKPLWFGSKEWLTKLGKTFLFYLLESGFSYAVKNKHAWIGIPDNVNKLIPLFDKHNGNIPQRDAEFHRTLGLALGYPEQDVETFIKIHQMV